jgi:hypothetical protein
VEGQPCGVSLTWCTPAAYQALAYQLMSCTKYRRSQPRQRTCRTPNTTHTRTHTVYYPRTFISPIAWLTLTKEPSAIITMPWGIAAFLRRFTCCRSVSKHGHHS